MKSETNTTSQRRPVKLLLVGAGVLLIVFLAFDHWGAGRADTPIPAGRDQFSASDCDPKKLTVDLQLPAKTSSVGSRFMATIQNLSSTQCTVSGNGPRLRLLQNSGDVVLQGEQGNSSASRNVAIGPSQRSSFEVLWSSWCGGPLDHVSMQVNPYSVEVDSWLASSGELSASDIPSCQNGRSSIQSTPLK